MKGPVQLKTIKLESVIIVGSMGKVQPPERFIKQ